MKLDFRLRVGRGLWPEAWGVRKEEIGAGRRSEGAPWAIVWRSRRVQLSFYGTARLRVRRRRGLRTGGVTPGVVSGAISYRACISAITCASGSSLEPSQPHLRHFARSVADAADLLAMAPITVGERNAAPVLSGHFDFGGMREGVPGLRIGDEDDFAHRDEVRRAAKSPPATVPVAELARRGAAP